MQDPANLSRLFKHHGFFQILLILSISYGSGNAVAQRQKNYPPEFSGCKTETYKSIGETKLNLWIFEEENSSDQAAKPAIVFFYGGGWRAGTPAQFEHHCRYLAKQGMIAITADYRVLTRHQTLADRSVADAKSAIRYIRSEAKRLGIDPNRIVAAGGSAGGHLAACTDLIETLDEPNEDHSVSSRPNAVAMFNPAVLIAPWRDVTLDEETLADIATRTGVPPEQISPIHHLRKAAAPSIIFHGKADSTVPYFTVEAYAAASKQLGNSCELIGYENEQHGFFNYGRGGNPGFAYLHTLSQLHQFLHRQGFLKNGPSGITTLSENIRLRQPFVNSWEAITQRKEATVAFIGGSITEMNGYRPMVSQWMQEKFPQTQFHFVNAGISSTCSTTGAFRLHRDVLSKKPDLVLIEFAVNDDQDAAHSREACIRGMEGIIRNARVNHPQADLLVTYFINPPMLETWQRGEIPLSVDAHESVMRHYGVSSVWLAKEIADRIKTSKLTWKDYGGTHPAPTGNQIAANLVQELLTTAWDLNPSLGIDPSRSAPPSLPKPMDQKSYQSGNMQTISDAELDDHWQINVPDWKTIQGGMRSRFANELILSASTVGAEMKLDFKGTAIGLYILAGPDAGAVEYQIDDQPVQTKDLYHRFSKGLHYPRTVILDDQLSEGSHRISIRVTEASDRKNSGTAVRIMAFATNGHP